MFAEDRQMMILGLIDQNGSVTTNELSEIFHVSKVTIRTDLENLEKSFYVQRTHGGAIRYRMSNSPYWGNHVLLNQDEKKKIGQFAVKLINPGDIIMLDSGTTTDQVAKNLGKIDNITCITTDYHVALSASMWPNVSVILSGGYIRGDLPLFGVDAIRNIQANSGANKYFMSVDSVSIRNGLKVQFLSVLENKKAMMNSSVEKILVADSSKFSLDQGAWIADIKDIDKIITANTLAQDTVKEIENLGIEIILV
jgi:DeoR family transcriptional regulator, aga operon transcriptional repressor